MSCDSFREALSARVDGEAADLPDDVVRHHLHICAGCRAWSAAVDDLVRATAVQLAPAVPDLTAEILLAADRLRRSAASGESSRLRRWAGAAIAPREPRRAAGEEPNRPVRWALAGLALIQLALTLPDLVFGGHPGGHVHMAHEVGSWDIALAVGFLVAALRPARAWGMLPLVAAIVGCLVVTTGLDVADGNALLGRHSTHALQVAGLLLVWALARRPVLRRTPRLQTV